VKERAIEILDQNKARVVDLERDIQVIDGAIIILIDGFEVTNFEEEEEEDVDSSEDEEEKQRRKEEKASEEEAKRQAEEALPEVWSCLACTFENAMALANCEICGTPRPPLEQIRPA